MTREITSPGIWNDILVVTRKSRFKLSNFALQLESELNKENILFEQNLVISVTVGTQIFAPCTQRFGPDDSKCSYELRLWRPPTASDDSLQNARSDLKKSLQEKKGKNVLVLYC